MLQRKLTAIQGNSMNSHKTSNISRLYYQTVLKTLGILNAITNCIIMHILTDSESHNPLTVTYSSQSLAIKPCV